MIIGLSGLAGSGKDTAAKFIVEKYNLNKIALADPMKRFCKEIYGFSEEQLWGESELRNKPDRRFPKPGRLAEYARILFDKVLPHDRELAAEYGMDTTILLKQMECDGWLTPRELLQRTAGDWGRGCYEDTWIDYGINVARKLNTGLYDYDKLIGLVDRGQLGKSGISGVVISDCRYINEINKVKAEGGKMIRIVGGKGLKGDYAKHLSESEQKQIPDSVFDYVILNNKSISYLENNLMKIFNKLI